MTQMLSRPPTPILNIEDRTRSGTGTRLQTESRRTGLLVTRQIDPLISAALEWEAAFLTSHISTVSVPEIGTGSAPASQTVESLVARTGLPKVIILNAAGISARTFFDWKKNERSPRLSSVGRLWILLQLVDDLTEMHPDLPAWIRRDPDLAPALGRADLDFVANYDRRREQVIQPVSAELEHVGAVGPEPESPPHLGRTAADHRPTERRHVGAWIQCHSS